MADIFETYRPGAWWAETEASPAHMIYSVTIGHGSGIRAECGVFFNPRIEARDVSKDDPIMAAVLCVDCVASFRDKYRQSP